MSSSLRSCRVCSLARCKRSAARSARRVARRSARSRATWPCRLASCCSSLCRCV